LIDALKVVTLVLTGLEAGLEGGIHNVQHLWVQHAPEEERGFLLVDALNTFNELNQTAMLWTIRHEWPFGTRFAFNCYWYWAGKPHDPREQWDRDSPVQQRRS
jgi:hypothetical protein